MMAIFLMRLLSVQLLSPLGEVFNHLGRLDLVNLFQHRLLDHVTTKALLVDALLEQSLIKVLPDGADIRAALTPLKVPGVCQEIWHVQIFRHFDVDFLVNVWRRCIAVLTDRTLIVAVVDCVPARDIGPSVEVVEDVDAVVHAHGAGLVQICLLNDEVVKVLDALGGGHGEQSTKKFH